MATILVVDDREINRRLLKTILSYNGHKIVEAADGAEALLRVREELPDLVITDILMPVVDGYEFVRQLREDKATNSVRVLFYSAAYLNPEAEALAKASGVVRVLSKPSEPSVILSAVEEALGTPIQPVVIEDSRDFSQRHRRLLTDKLARKVEELEIEVG